VIRPSQRPLHDNTPTLKRQASVSPKGFESVISASKWPHTKVLDRAATGIGCLSPIIDIQYIGKLKQCGLFPVRARYLILLHSFQTHPTFCPGCSQALGLATECICIFCILRIKRDYAPKRHNGRDLCDADAMFALPLMREKMKLCGPSHSQEKHLPPLSCSLVRMYERDP